MEKSFLWVFYGIANLAAFIAVMIINTLANTLPLNGIGTGELSDLYPNLFVPAGITFSIWGIIYLLLAGFVIYSLAASLKQNIDASFLKAAGPWFIISSLCNIGWIFAWHWKKPGISLLLMSGLLLSLIIIYLRLDGWTADNKLAGLLVKTPFIVYTGWITVATIANITAFLVSRGWRGFGLSETVWAVIVIAAALSITAAVIITKGDPAFSLVIIWALAGIIIKRTALADAPAVVIAASVSIAVITILNIVRAAQK